jgi:hypothetical protein
MRRYDEILKQEASLSGTVGRRIMLLGRSREDNRDSPQMTVAQIVSVPSANATISRLDIKAGSCAVDKRACRERLAAELSSQRHALI